jgi:predicted AlkP superfamily pyrophosphatase or phosphodiesterase
MPQPLVILNVVGLTPRHLGPDTPRIGELTKSAPARPMIGVLPAVTCTAQATLLTGLPPQGHGVVGNGWFHRDTGEVRFWLQSNRLMAGETLYAAARRLASARGELFTCAKMFWWFNQGAAVDWSVTPKPFYGADGSKELAIQSTPADLAPQLEKKFGAFPFSGFWGPMAGLPSSDWISRASAEVITGRKPTLTLVYLPHLDYDLQRFGPDAPATRDRVREADACAGRVIDAARAIGAAVMVVSEYGLMPVRRPVYINRALRSAGYLSVRDGPFGETIDTFNSAAFAVVDHQLAHVVVTDPERVGRVEDLVRALPGVAGTAVGADRGKWGLDHPRSGDIVALSDRDAWFAYPYWLDEARAPDFARTVDIHRKPGYDPCELFFDPKLTLPTLRVARRIAAKKLGFRYLLDVVPLEAELIRGSHGVEPVDSADGPVLIAPGADGAGPFPMTGVKDLALRLMGLW